MENKNNRKQLSGVIVSDKMDKTAVVLVSRRYAHPVYNKLVNKSKKYYAHDPENSCKMGDLVLIEEFRPLSKLKRWKIKNIQQKAVN